MPFRLADAIFWIAVACCCIAQLAIVRSIVISPSVAGATPAGRGRRVAEVLWAILPGLVLVAVLVFTWRAMRAGEVTAARASVAAVVSRA